MWTDDLLMLLTYMNKFFPNVLIDHIDRSGIIHCTSFHKIDLFMFKARPDKMIYLLEVLNADPA